MEQIESCVPPGFRFHPTEEELVGYYLKRKVTSLKCDLDVIIDIDLYRMEPWDIQGKCKSGGDDEKNEWYFFSHKDRKYPTGRRTNRATTAGFWKATGRDKAVLSKNKMIGMRKTLVFYKGRAPNGNKTDWIMHEYRLQTTEHAPTQEEGWVVCRAFKKASPNHKQGFGAWNHRNNYYYYMRNNCISHNSLMSSPSVPDIASPVPADSSHQGANHFQHQHFVQCYSNYEHELMSNNNFNPIQSSAMLDLPRLDSPSFSTSFATTDGFDQRNGKEYELEKSSSNLKWEILNNLLVSQTPETTSLYSNPSISQLVPHDYELEVQNDQFIGCYSDL